MVPIELNMSQTLHAKSHLNFECGFQEKSNITSIENKQQERQTDWIDVNYGIILLYAVNMY